MSKDDFDIYTHLRKDSKRAALNLINGLENRRYGYLFGCGKSKEDLDIYAEEEFIRKKDYEELRCEMPGVPRSTFLMVFSPDGSKVASTHGNHNIYITDIKSGKNIKTLVGHPRTPWCIAFHPTSDQIVASGCLGGQVRIWDLSGGSEVWTAAHQTVIASLAFHPNDRVLVIATYNEVYFWDWSQPEPFVHAATSNPKEKVRYVAFDNLGHKLITGIANSPQTRWERVRAPVPVPRQAMCSNPYRRRITQRLANPPGTSHSPSDSRFNNREGSIDLVPNIPLRERRITACYRNLVREYEQLVQRYLQLYRPPTMIDRGTDPMEPNPWFNNSGTQTSNDQTESSDGSTPGPSTVNTTIRNNPEPGPSTSVKAEGNDTEQPSTSDSTTETHTLITPSRIFNTMKKPETSFRGTQTVESRKHKADAASGEPCQEKRFKKSDKRPLKRSANRATSETAGTSTEGQNQEQRGSEVQSQEQRSREGQQEQRRDEKALRVELEQLNSPVEVSIGPESTASVSDTSEFRIRSRVEEEAMSNMSSDQALAESNNTDPEVETTHPMASEIRQSTAPLSNSQNLDGPSTSISSDSSRNPTINGVEELLLNIRRTAEEEVRNRILPIINSVPANDRPELIRLFENGREHVRKRVRQMYPVFLRRPNRRHLNIIDSSESSTSDEDNSNSDSRLSRCNLEGPSHVTSQTSVTTNSTTSISGASSSTPSVTSSSSVRNFNTELEQLVTSLLTEIERDDDRSPRSGTLPSASLITNTSTPSTPTTTPTPLLPNPFSPSSSQLGEASTASTPSNRPFSSLLFQECLRVLNSRDDTPPTSTASTISAGSTPITSSTAQDVDNRASSAEAPPATGVNTNTRTTNSTIYTSISLPRRRFFSHRISAFMPTRVDYHRLARLRRSPHISGGRARPSPFFHWQSALDEIINYAERENSEDDPPPPTTPPLHPPSHESSFSSLDPLPDPPRTDHVSNIYSNILHDIEFSLDDVLSMRASDILGINNTHMRSFSERLDSIVNQSDQILRNVANSMEMMSNAEEPSPNRSQGADPAWSTVYDNNFFMRERSESSNLDLESRNDTINLSHLFHTPISTAIATDHTYPRNPDSASAGQSEDMTPIMSLIHMTISHIQRQAQQVRQRVEVLERIDRANIEISQLQLIRQLLIELTRYVRSGDVRNRSTGGMSSVRQMMAGTRISDSSPQESTSEESPSTTTPPVVPPSSSSSSNVPTSSTEEPSTSSGQARSRASSRKTYPPSRLYRLSARPYRKHSMYQFIGRRYLNRGGAGSARQGSARTTAAGGLLPLGISHEQYLPSEGSSTRPLPAPPRPPSALPLTANTLSMTTRRLERRLVEQMRVFMSMQPQSQNTQNRRVDLGEHILMLRLHGCVLRMNRILGHNPVSNVLGNIRADPTAAVTRDGVARFGPRHNLSLLIDDISRNVEGGPGNLHFLLRCQILRVLGIGILLTELMLLVVVDNIQHTVASEISDGNNLSLDLSPTPPPLMSLLRFSTAPTTSIVSQNHARQLSRSLRLMRRTVHHAQSVLEQSYSTRVMAFMPYNRSDRRRQLLICINRCLKALRQRSASNPAEESSSSSSRTNAVDGESSSQFSDGDWYTVVNDIVNQTAAYTDDTQQPSTSSGSREHRIPPERASQDRPTPSPERPSTERPSPSDRGPPSTAMRLLRRIFRPTSPEGRPRSPDMEAGTSSNNAGEGRSGTGANGSTDWYHSFTNLMNGYSVPSQDEEVSRPNATPSSSFRDRPYRFSRLPTINLDYSDPDDDETYNNNNYATQNGNLFRNNPTSSGPGGDNAGGSSSNTRSYTVPAVQVNDVPVSEPTLVSHRVLGQRQRQSEVLHNYPIGLFRPRFLHPLYASVNPFDADLDDPQREQIYESDMVTTVTPNHRIQAWDVSNWEVPVITNTLKNVVVGECKIHNDASVDIAKDGTVLVTLLPSGGYLNVTNRLGVYSLRWETLGQCLYTTSFEQNAVSVSLSPLSRHLVVGLASRIVPSDRWIMARIFKIEQKDVPGDRLPVLRELQQNRDSRINCIRWLPTSGQGLIYATNTGQLVMMS